MRLKQLLGILLLLCIGTAVAAAAASELSQVNVTPSGSATLVTLRATGGFTHTEYRPTDNLLLVDLSGVSAERMDGKTHLLHSPGVVSYRVLDYRSSDGANVARLELALASGSTVHLTEGANELNLRVVAGNGEPTSAMMSPGTVAPARVSSQTAIVQRVGIVRADSAVAIEISASHPIEPKALKLSGPDRLVLDIPNATVAPSVKAVAVNSGEIKDVRVARYQENPPVTRIVVDLVRDQDFEVVPNGSTLLVKFHQATVSIPALPQGAQSASAMVANAAMAVEKPSAPAGTAEKPAATNFAVVRPEMHTVTAAETAAGAASKFAARDTAFDLTSESSASLKPAALTEVLPFQAAAAPAPAPAATSSRPKYTGEPISVNLKDVDLKDFFRLIHEISGLNVVLDPNVHGTLTLVLDDVPWDQALDIVLKNNGLDRQLEGNVLRIATVETLRKEADARRAQIEAQALAVDKVTVTRFLSYAHSKDVVTTVKQFLSSRGNVVADDRTNALIIDDIPNVIPKVDDLLAKLDRKTPEVEIEARVVAATRDFAREIGTQFGFGWGNTPTAVGGGLAQNAFTQNNASNAQAPNYVVTGSHQIPLFSNLPAVNQNSAFNFINADNNYRIDFLLSMSESRGLLKILSRPRVVTQNNIQALVRQGVRVPVVTQAQLGGPPTVTYVDAFLRLSVTPQITAENTIFLNVDVENTTPDFSRQINGNPTLVTQQATTQVLVTDGGTVVIGGVIQTKNSVTIDQVPLLGNIPLLGNLFKHRAVSTETQELIFFITPRIVQT